MSKSASIPIVTCSQCGRSAEWTDGTDTEFWCPTCGAETPVCKTCSPSTLTLAPGLTIPRPESSPFPITRQDVTDLLMFYLGGDDISEGFLGDMLRDCLGLDRSTTRALWFDAMRRGEELAERWHRERGLKRSELTIAAMLEKGGMSADEAGRKAAEMMAEAAAKREASEAAASALSSTSASDGPAANMTDPPESSSGP